MVGGLLLSCGGAGGCAWSFPLHLPAVLAVPVYQGLRDPSPPRTWPVSFSARPWDDVHAKSGVRLRRLHLFPLQLHADHHKRRGGEPAQWGHGTAFSYLAPCRRSHSPPSPRPCGGSSLFCSWASPCWPIPSWPPCFYGMGKSQGSVKGGGKGGGVNGHVSLCKMKTCLQV